MNKLEIVKRIVYVIRSECPNCGFKNPQDERFYTCPICKTDLVVTTIDSSKTPWATIPIA